MFQVGNLGAVNSYGEFCYNLEGTDIVYNEMTTTDFNLKNEAGETVSIGYCYEAFGIIVNKALLEKAGYPSMRSPTLRPSRPWRRTSTPALPSWASTLSRPPVSTVPPPGVSPATWPTCLCTTSSAMTA